MNTEPGVSVKVIPIEMREFTAILDQINVIKYLQRAGVVSADYDWTVDEATLLMYNAELGKTIAHYAAETGILPSNFKHLDLKNRENQSISRCLCYSQCHIGEPFDWDEIDDKGISNVDIKVNTYTAA
jgi:hypothetical protein